MLYAGINEELRIIKWIINKSSIPVCNNISAYNSEIDIDKISQGLDFTGKGWLFYITGGEPFFENNIIQLCHEITKENYVALDTKLPDEKVYQFADRINPNRCLFINTEVDKEEADKIKYSVDGNIRKIEYLKNKGFKVLIDGVTLPGKEGKKYRNFNHICMAGQLYLVMDRDGNLTRCSSTLRSYGNLFENTFIRDMYARPCPLKECRYSDEGIQNVLSCKGTYTVALRDYIREKYLKMMKKIMGHKNIPEIFNKNASIIESRITVQQCSVE